MAIYLIDKLKLKNYKISPLAELLIKNNLYSILFLLHIKFIDITLPPYLYLFNIIHI
jgi:hypothetical protein